MDTAQEGNRTEYRQGETACFNPNFHGYRSGSSSRHDYKTTGTRVSILIFMDTAQEVTALVLFLVSVYVSILIFMDTAQEAKSTAKARKDRKSFNPNFHGYRSGRVQRPESVSTNLMFQS